MKSGQQTAIGNLIQPLEPRSMFAVFVVSTINDSGAGSLRQALADANSLPGADVVQFAIGTGAKTITPATGLPAITDPLLIDGSTQPGYAGVPLIELSGISAPSGTRGLILAAGSSTVRGLAINRFRLDGIELSGGSGNTIQGCYIGTTSAGSAAAANTGVGIYVSGSNNALIGGSTFSTTAGTFSARNVVSGNNSEGIFVESSTGTIIRNNFIGLNAAGTSAIANKTDGVFLGVATTGSVVGGLSTADRNVISGNKANGIQVAGSGASNNTILGNYVGLRASGTAAVANGSNGIKIDGTLASGVTGNTVGGTSPGAGNVISGNVGDGIQISGGATTTLVQGNFVGTNTTGSGAIANSGNGINIVASPGNTIGGTSAAARNIMSGNLLNGIELQDTGADNNLVQGNYVGTDSLGVAAIPNRDDGVDINSASFNVIGGTAPGARNLISGNKSDGIEIAADSLRFAGNADSNVVEGNLIGTNASGTSAIPNDANGVRILDASGGTFAFHNRIGGSTVAARNIISGNLASGVATQGLKAVQNTIQGNYIGTNPAGDLAIPNGTPATLIVPASGSGVTLLSNENTVGGSAAGEGNLISGNLTHGVDITGSKNIVMGNLVGTTSTGLTPLPNQEVGVNIFSSLLVNAVGNVIGGTSVGAANTVAGNVQHGVKVNGTGSAGNLIEGNRVGIGLDGVTAVPNLRNGVQVSAGMTTTIRGNSIYANGDLGIDLGGDGVTPNDATDLDTGANELQNMPVIASAGPNQITISLDSTPLSSFTIELFISPIASASGYGQGKTPLASILLATDGSGMASTVYVPVSALPVGSVVTAIATDAAGNSSEFSAAVTVSSSLTTVTASSFAFDHITQQIQYVFSSDVSASIDASDLLLQNLTFPGSIPASSIVASATGTSAQFEFQGLPGSILPDGIYRATLVASGVLDAGSNPIDGDNNGSPGGDHVFEFFFLGGDANRDRKVDTQDFNLLAAHFGSAGVFSEGNFNYDTAIDSADFNVFMSQYGKSLPASSPLMSSNSVFRAEPVGKTHAIDGLL